MHFWINKPAGRYYGFTGRRYPATPVPKSHNQCRRGGELRQMVTPVHRFQGLASNLAAGNASPAGPSNVNNSCRNIVARSATSVRIHNNENRHHGSSSLSAAQLAQLNNIPNNVTDASNNQLILSNPTGTNGTDRNRSLLTGSVFDLREAELAGFRLRCGIWSTFAVATVFVAAAKFYFGYRGPGLEILVFCGLLILLLSACLYSIFCKYHRESHYHHSGQSEHNARMQEDHILDERIQRSMNQLMNVSSIGDNVVSRATATVPTVRQNPPPPPYHIAILIPPPSPPPLASSDEAPPPSYDKVMR
ncbi:uncharacterized protein LOC105198861 [Solenopsis invicta]|uniref:uncharacterized protein LOC105198861 n=1 Tax=Solenopsis invicta TaxID=13686 RepID=UPI0005960825|nr:uncharacterized protein LOC105198861 [Solenopsis invicta]XP_011164019.1 uncharacterized protein LOC105198861 [Solenopsis invicta]XP_039312911.1 uncharacterized protein LOC105198861 [Solenopsis invicta]